MRVFDRKFAQDGLPHHAILLRSSSFQSINTFPLVFERSSYNTTRNVVEIVSALLFIFKVVGSSDLNTRRLNLELGIQE